MRRDLITLHMDSGFCLGEMEGPGHFLNLGLKSKELDPYFVGRASGNQCPETDAAANCMVAAKSLLGIEEVQNRMLD